tara:strand:+ start:1515 stop:1757 length:243 start_codon:yes stop_codon:yes gene_type:complete
MKKYKKWSSEELCYISENCNKMKDKELATLLSEKINEEITVDMIRRQRRKLQIRKKQGRHRNDKVKETTDSWHDLKEVKT